MGLPDELIVKIIRQAVTVKRTVNFTDSKQHLLMPFAYSKRFTAIAEKEYYAANAFTLTNFDVDDYDKDDDEDNHDDDDDDQEAFYGSRTFELSKASIDYMLSTIPAERPLEHIEMTLHMFPNGYIMDSSSVSSAIASQISSIRDLSKHFPKIKSIAANFRPANMALGPGWVIWVSDRSWFQYDQAGQAITSWQMMAQDLRLHLTQIVEALADCPIENKTLTLAHVKTDSRIEDRYSVGSAFRVEGWSPSSNNNGRKRLVDRKRPDADTVQRIVWQMMDYPSSIVRL